MGNMEVFRDNIGTNDYELIRNTIIYLMPWISIVAIRALSCLANSIKMNLLRILSGSLIFFLVEGSVYI